MLRFSYFVVLIVLLGVAGCVTPSTDPRLVGTYVGADSERLIFERDTGVYYIDGRERRVFIGYVAAVSTSAPGALSIAGPDTSHFIGTSFQVSDDFRTVTVRWGDFIGGKDTPRQTQFVRRGNG